MTAKNQTVILLVSIPFVAAIAVPLYVLLAQAFSGPNCAAGQCNGAIGLDANNNLSIGTSTPQSDTKLVVVGTSTGSGYFAIKVIDTQRGPLLLVRSDGSVTIGSNQFAGGGPAAPGVGNQSAASGGLFVHGPIVSDVSISSTVISGNFNGTVSAGNVSNGVFGSNVGNGNFAFPTSLGVGTSSQVGLPQALSVYGGAYISGTIYGAQAGTAQMDTAGVLRAAEYDTIGNQLSLGTCGIFISFGTSCATAEGSGIAGIYGFEGHGGPIHYQAGSLGDPNNSPLAYAHYFETVSSSVAQTPGYLLGVASGRNTVFSIASSGNTGIGTTTVSRALTVNGDIYATGNITCGGACGGGAGQWTTTSTGIFYNGGRVGIGTAVPAYPIDVVGDANITGVYRKGGTAGVSPAACPAGQTFSGVTVSGGIVTSAGGCVALGAGTVTSVSGSGGTTGLTLSGGPITTAGTLTLGGTLAISNGGTGLASPSLAAGSGISVTGFWPNQTIATLGGTLSNIVVFTANGTYTKPAAVTKIRVRMVGGGGDSGSDATYGGSGGGAGGYCESLISSPASSYSVTIGNSGVRVVPSAGTASSFGASMTASGGGIGSGSAAGGVGGTGSGCQINIKGGDGGAGGGGAGGAGGVGGSSALGGGGRGGSTGVAGLNGGSYGGGGGGSGSGLGTGANGVGAAGTVIVEEYE